MNQFKAYQDALEELYPSLTVFSDIKWDEVSQEYLASHDERPTDIEEFVFNFPAFLQEKAIEGDAPPYLFELAFFELLQNQMTDVEIEAPDSTGIYLNPTLSFLNLEFDVAAMFDEAAKGNVQILARPHVLCIYHHPEKGLHHVDITTPMLEVLQKFEDAPLNAREVLSPEQQKTLNHLIDLGLILEAI
jgi:hypothetical protein